ERLPVVLLDGVHGADARMAQGRGGARLALEPLEHRSVLRERGGQELDGDVAPEPRVLGLVDHAHATRAELSQDPVMRNRRSEQRRLLERGRTVPRSAARPRCRGWRGDIGADAALFATRNWARLAPRPNNQNWCARRDSNARPLAPEANALS